ncbi:hypothetical protein H0H81_007838 [Sphagnurus paluster]|uniref:Uncharacterized protein n=1 Tax=Sphagnurus paluster TaxID=117069 RepID=A0A9P7GJ97_9AGAR|nr:hypothetical protein H0H81_007838 [Sphagnurus paluster]
MQINELDVSFLSPLLPSLLLIEDEHNIRLNAEAANINANIGSLKCLLAFIGGEFTEKNGDLLPFVLKEMQDGVIGVQVGLSGGGTQVFPALELVSLFIRRIIATTSAIAHSEVIRAVITIPGWFSDTQKHAMAEACKMAGLKIFGVITETMAAHIRCVASHLKTVSTAEYNVFFIDIGHTATSLSILSLCNGKPIVKCEIFDTSFGGRDIDIAILNHLGTLEPELLSQRLSE